jgi:hypothetical protein
MRSTRCGKALDIIPELVACSLALRKLLRDMTANYLTMRKTWKLIFLELVDIVLAPFAQLRMGSEFQL